MMSARNQGARGRFARPARGRRGFALPFAMLITLLVMITGLSLLEVSRMEAIIAERDVRDVKALAAAEFGLNRAKAMARSQNLPWGLMTYNGASLQFTQSSDPIYEGHYVCELFTDEPAGYEDDAPTYTVVIEDRADWSLRAGSYRIHAFGRAGERVQHITEDTQCLTYAAFGWLTDREDGIYFATGDTVDGWVYTNDHLNIYGSPTFTGKVNSAGSYINYYHGGPPADNPDFQQGVTLNSPRLDMASLIHSGHVTGVRDRALQADGIWLGPNSGRPYIVTFNANGTVTVDKKLWDGSWSRIIDEKDLSATNGAIYVEETVGVRGTVDGQVTLATPENKDIYVLDDLVYASPSNPASAFQPGFNFDDPAFDDKLGLIAGRDIIMYKSWDSSWSDMYVMASLLAVTGSMRNYYYTSYGFKTLHILGGVAQDTRGPVGRADNRGFLKDYKYDQRFLEEPPPHFPIAMYDYSLWQLNP